MLYFKILRDNPSEGKDIWDYKKVDPALFTAEGLLRDINLSDGYAEVTEEEYLAEVAEGTEGRSEGEEGESEEDASDESEEGSEDESDDSEEEAE